MGHLAYACVEAWARPVVLSIKDLMMRGRGLCEAVKLKTCILTYWP